uniref:Uncharacterized protein n=1 Tax=Guillardia theta TaxID=55529 RepID=A0A7S4N8M8_GUITH|mmetsp:Transcript_18098/g.59438  ORF Transcript_18098/g.59438 Transcript_18098/m.59438 type:complete len:188 (+) Transcript_18098:36-599(+)
MLEFAEELETEQIYQWEEDERYYDLIAARKVEDSLRETERSLLVTPNWEGDDVKEEQAAADEINEQDEASRLWAIRIAAMQQELEELRSQVEMKDAQLRRLTDDRENIMKNSSRHVEEMNDRQVREEDLKQENEELKRQLKLAKEQIEKQNRIHVERSKLEECKYAEAKRINAILQTRLAHSKSGAA